MSARLSGERDEVVLTELEHEKDRRAAATVRDQMGTTRPHGVRLAGHQADVLFGITQEDAQGPLDDEERVLHARVVVPRHALARADLQLRDSKPRSLGMVSRMLDLEEGACRVTGFHHDLLVRWAVRGLAPGVQAGS